MFQSDPSTPRLASCQPRSLVLFTAHFPFGNGETFLENELPVLARHFEHVIVQPASVQRGDKPRHMPPNAIAQPPINRKRTLEKWLFGGVSLIFHPVLRNDVITKNVLVSRLRMQECLVAAGYDRFMRDWAIENAATLRNAVCYFYWGRGPAYGIEHVRAQTNCRIIVRLHGYDLFEERNAGYIPLREEVFTAADQLFSVSEAGRKYLCERYPRYASRFGVARLGTNDHGDGHFEGDKDSLTLVSCANVITLKRITLLAKMLRSQTSRKIHWHHFGDGDERGAVETLIEGFPPTIRATLHGQKTNSEVIEFYRNNHVDAFVSVSETEGVPVSIMEATSFGIPVIATDVGGTAEILTKEGAFLLTPQFNGTEFEEAIQWASVTSKDKTIRREIRNHWREVAYAETNYEAFVRDALLDGH